MDDAGFPPAVGLPMATEYRNKRKIVTATRGNILGCDSRGLTIVAEVACAHEGDMNSLLKMIEVASQAKVDVIQFQFFQAAEISVESSELYPLACKLQIPLSFYDEIFSCARRKGLDVWATVGDLISAERAYGFMPDMWRVHSSDINNASLIEFLCGTNIPISFSVGGSTMEEIDYAVKLVRQSGGEVKALIHGFQGYPTPIEEANLAFISSLRAKYGCSVGYQDHTDPGDPLSTSLSLMALACGAEIVEKHFTLDRSKKGIDHHASLNPDELAVFVLRVRGARSALGSAEGRIFGACEAEYRKTFKKGFVFRRALPSGTRVSGSDIKIVRSDHLEIYGNRIGEVRGRTLKHNVEKDQIVKMEDFTDVKE
jgi:sialic acid synthase SpsE